MSRSESARYGGENRPDKFAWTETMKLPLFPLNVVLFPGMVMPLHIFEPRYLEMVGRCLEENSPFGVVYIAEGELAQEDVLVGQIGTAARIVRSEDLSDGRMNITTVGAKRFRIVDLDHSESYLSATVKHFPAVNGSTRDAVGLAQLVRPRIVEYVDLISKASRSKLGVDRLPEDPTTLAFLIAIAMQVGNEEKQHLLSLAGIPEMLVREHQLLGSELQLMRFMIETADDVRAMTSGPTGQIFPN